MSKTARSNGPPPVRRRPCDRPVHQRTGTDTLGLLSGRSTCNNLVINVDPRRCHITLQVRRVRYGRYGAGPPPTEPEELYDEDRSPVRWPRFVDRLVKRYGPPPVNGGGAPVSGDISKLVHVVRKDNGRPPDAHCAWREKIRLAERKKSDGNDKYSKLLYKEALVSYSKAIDLCPDCAAYYSNRSACYMMLGKYSDALADARESIRLDSEFVKGYLRVGKCNIALGDANAALSVLRHASDIDATKAVRDEINKAQTLYKCLEEINKFITKKEYRTAVFHIDKALLYAVACQSLKISKAENLVFLQRFSEAEGIVNDILQSDGAHPDAIYVRGLCLYYQDNQAAALTHFQHVLRLAPDHKKAKDAFKRAKALRAKKDAGNNAFNKAQWREALNLYTEAIAIDSTNSATLAKLYFNRATSEAKLDEYEESVRDCTEAINRNEDYVKAYVRRAKSNQVLEKHEEAVRDYEKASRLSNGHEYDRLLREAKIQLKRSKRKDYFKILGVSKSASDDEIKKAYRKKALMHHPDRHANSSEKERRDHEVQFKEIGEAYTILTDPKKKSMYENGHNINDSDDYNNYTDGGFDPTEIFQAFFSSGGGGTPYGAASGHGRQHFNFGGSSQGPFSFM